MNKFYLVIIAFLAVSLTFGCTMPAGRDTVLGAYYAAAGTPRHLRRPIRLISVVPVAPSRVGFNRPPSHWERNIFRFQIINETQQYHVRCVIDGQAHVRTVRGRVFNAHVETKSGLETRALIPPGEMSYLILGPGRHNMKCELYGGPVKVMPNGAHVFSLVRHKWFRDFTPDQFPDQMYKINDIQILSYN